MSISSGLQQTLELYWFPPKVRNIVALAKQKPDPAFTRLGRAGLNLQTTPRSKKNKWLRQHRRDAEESDRSWSAPPSDLGFPVARIQLPRPLSVASFSRDRQRVKRSCFKADWARSMSAFNWRIKVFKLPSKALLSSSPVCLLPKKRDKIICDPKLYGL